jgi:hypothetical protein
MLLFIRLRLETYVIYCYISCYKLSGNTIIIVEVYKSQSFMVIQILRSFRDRKLKFFNTITNTLIVTH